jgi:AmmeMemoRadiSam system protein B
VKIRERGLPDGWYPGSEQEIMDLIHSWPLERSAGSALAGIVPHAGWSFCGSMIADVLRLLPANLDTIVVLGGHNPPGMPPIRYSEDAWDMPSGRLFRDVEFSDHVESLLPDNCLPEDERFADNTVEVIVPLVAAIHPGVKWTAWRLPADIRAVVFGEAIAAAALNLGRRTAVIGSTDLTHYGPNYGFMPAESEENPIEWVKQRDMRILEAIAEFSYDLVLDLATRLKSACSAGAAVGTMAYAGKTGAKSGRILGYSTSRDVFPSPSFVGYGGLIWESV